MKIKFHLILVACVAFASCKENKNTTTGGVKDSVKPSSGNETAATVTDASLNDAGKFEAKDSVMAFIVSFYSIGSGIDRGQPDKLKSFADAFGKKANVQVEYSETHWGREGETDYCFPLKGLSDVQVIEFKNGAKETLKDSEHVHFIENQVCRKGR